MNGIDRPIRYRPSPDPYASSTDPEYLQNGVGRIYDLRRLAMAVTSPLADDAWVTEPHGHGKVFFQITVTDSLEALRSCTQADGMVR